MSITETRQMETTKAVVHLGLFAGGCVALAYNAVCLAERPARHLLVNVCVYVPFVLFEAAHVLGHVRAAR